MKKYKYFFIYEYINVGLYILYSILYNHKIHFEKKIPLSKELSIFLFSELLRKLKTENHILSIYLNKCHNYTIIKMELILNNL